MRCPAEQRGAALITVMMIMALASVAVTEIVTRQHLEVRRAGSREAFESARALDASLAAQVSARIEALRAESPR